MQSVVDEHGRVLIPQHVRESVGITAGTRVQLHRKGKAVVISPTGKRGRRSWSDLSKIEPKRTGKPKRPTPEEIKSIGE